MDASNASRGCAHPLGSTAWRRGGVNFSLHAPDAKGVSLVLYEKKESKGSFRHVKTYVLDENVNRTGHVWHVRLPSGALKPEWCYAYLLDGCDKTVLDPRAQGVVSRLRYGVPDEEEGCWPLTACALPSYLPGKEGIDFEPGSMDVTFPSKESFDWEGDVPPSHHPADLIIYEAHVRGFTKDASSRTESVRGTYAALAEKMPYLSDLGINCIELMPVHEFNELEYYAPNPATGEYRYNFWGYSTTGFYSPMSRYSACASEGTESFDGGRGVLREFKQFVKVAHQHGMEVVLDVVFNHTAEGNEMGPTLSFKGLDQRGFYMLAPMGEFYNYSGCGNTVNVNHPMTRRFILDCLRHWVTEYHVDGFRFDLGAILTRSSDKWMESEVYGSSQGEGGLDALPTIALGTPLERPPVLDLISNDGILRSVKLIAEAWDCGGLYQVGAFPHFGAWAEWNGKFRDSVRSFIKGTDGTVGLFAGALCGSPELYESGGRSPYHSINFITAHDGFSLNDLVSYNEKHNEANGEENRDGDDHNLSWNCGVEGVPPEGVEEDVRMLRDRQMRNFFVALMVAQGVPMITMGDEYGHTKEGNNNTYCHDNALNWFAWDEMEQQRDGLVRFVKGLVHLRKRCPQLRLRSFPTAEVLQWFGKAADEPDWSETSRFVSFILKGPENHALYVAFSPSHVPEFVNLPPSPRGSWKLVADTARLPPYDLVEQGTDDDEKDLTYSTTRPYLANSCYPMLPYSSIILETSE